MPDIAAFVTARLDEAQKVAEAIPEGRWWLGTMTKARDTIESGNGVVGDLYPGYVDHVLLHDPARTLRGIAAKRDLVEQYLFARMQVSRDKHFPSVVLETLEVSMRSFASVDADHPDYDPSWAVG